MANPLRGWRVDPAAITLVGHDLRRPECVLAEAGGDLWAADLRGGVVHIRPDGSQEVVVPRDGGGPFAPPGGKIDGNHGFSMPNGLCFDRNGDIIIANFGTNAIERLTRDGSWSLILDRIDGEPLGKCNFPAVDSKGRLWFSVTASQATWTRFNLQENPDGYIAIVDEAGPRIVARGLCGANEFRFDEDETRLYVAETAADHITRFRVRPDGTLTDREIYGPARLGGAPDGFAFDSAGNLWITLVGADRLVALTPEGEVMTLWEDRDPSGRTVTPGSLTDSAGGVLAPRMASVTFGGADLCTVHIGSLLGTSLPTFRSPVPGRALGHWGMR